MARKVTLPATARKKTLGLSEESLEVIEEADIMTEIVPKMERISIAMAANLRSFPAKISSVGTIGGLEMAAMKIIEEEIGEAMMKEVAEKEVIMAAMEAVVAEIMAAIESGLVIITIAISMVEVIVATTTMDKRPPIEVVEAIGTPVRRIKALAEVGRVGNTSHGPGLASNVGKKATSRGSAL